MNSYILIVILIILSALFSGSEISYASSNELKLKKHKDDSNADSLTYKIFNNYDKALISILIGNNLVNIASSSIATVIAITLLGNKGAFLATALMTIIIIIFGEITPKIIASRKPESFAKLVSYPIYIIMIITKPIVFIANKIVSLVSNIWKSSLTLDEVTTDDLETIIDTAEEEAVIDEDTADLLQNALDFDDVLAYEIITHRLDTEAIDIEDDKKKNIDIIMNTQYSRLPVYKDNFDNIEGFVIVDECLMALSKKSFVLKEHIHKPLFIHKTTKLDDALVMMKQNNCHLGIVTDEYGGTMGIITMEDILEELVGDIWDEKDVIDEEFEEIKKDVYEVQGEMRIEELFEELNIDDEDFDSDNATVGGWAIEMIGHYPKKNESFVYQDYIFEITEVDDLRVKELRVKQNR